MWPWKPVGSWWVTSSRSRMRWKATGSPDVSGEERTMNIFLWIVQILLALAFLMAGILKTMQPIDKLAARMKWVNSLRPPQLVRLIGVLELLGAIGLILPAVTGIWPWL